MSRRSKEEPLAWQIAKLSGLMAFCLLMTLAVVFTFWDLHVTTPEKIRSFCASQGWVIHDWDHCEKVNGSTLLIKTIVKTNGTYYWYGGSTWK